MNFVLQKWFHLWWTLSMCSWRRIRIQAIATKVAVLYYLFQKDLNIFLEVASLKMSQQQVDLETLQFILSQFTDDIADDCSKIISKLLKPLSIYALQKSEINFEKVYATVKILLILYERLNVHEANPKSKLPVNIIIDNVKLFLNCSSESCNVPENDVQLNILSIISLVIKNELLQNSLEELAELYKYILSYSCATITGKECKPECLIFKLKIMTAVYQVLANNEFESCHIELKEKIKSIESNEWEFITNLVLHEDDMVAFLTLFHLIPAQSNCFNNNNIVEVIWKKISAFKNSGKFSRVLIILCQIFDIFFDKLKDEVDLNILFFEDENYWELIQFALKDKDPVKRKQGLYLLKKTIDVLNTENRNHGNDKCLFYWDTDYKDELYKIYTEIILILEFLEEQQIHIIKPIFNLIDTVTDAILNSKKINFSWILVIYEKVLSHESLQVVKWGLDSFLKLHENFFSNMYFASKSAEFLASILNNLSLYFHNGLNITDKLKYFFKKVSYLSTSKIFFSTFIKQICSQVWSGEALFFVIYSFSDFSFSFNYHPLWGKDEISELITFVLKAFKTHNKIIRTGTQIKLLKTCLAFFENKNVPLESFIYLISIFLDRQILKLFGENWHEVITWLKSSYSIEDVKSILEKYLYVKPINEPKYITTMFILFYYAYDVKYEYEYDCGIYIKLNDSNKNNFFLNYFQKILLLYKEINKRPYCNKKLYDETLSIICYMYQTDINNSDFTKPTLPFLNDIILYVQSQLYQISDIYDLNDIKLYISTFENITKTLILFKFDIEYTNHLYIKILEDLESSESNISSIGMFWRIKILNIILELNCVKPKSSFLDSYLLKTINEALKKDDNYSNKTRDLLSLWGKLNSEFLVKKWEIFYYLINYKLIIHGYVKDTNKCWISNDDLVVLCIEALNVGGYEVLCPVMSILKNVIIKIENSVEVKNIIDSVWKVIMERRKTEEFKMFIEKFAEMVFQEVFIDKGESTIEILLKYADLIFSDSSIAVVNIFMKHVQQLDLTKSVELYCFIIGKGLIYGSMERKVDKLTKTVCFHIEHLKICKTEELGDYNTSNEVRARAVQKILQLDKKSPTHQNIAKQLIDTLFKMEKELNKNRSRYFGNSQVHRVKHRLMQALLILEPILGENPCDAIKLSKLVLHSLVSENSQPSVRYMQEWLLIRMIIRRSCVHDMFYYNNYYINSEENTKKGTCSLIGIMYHTYWSFASSLFERINFQNILTFCFHQHFEISLYAQVAFTHLYRYCKELNITDKKIQNYEEFFNILYCCPKVDSDRNRNFFKLKESFYFNDFHPLNSYSLETIYKDLPRLTDVSSDERISAKMFQYCGVKSNEIEVPFKKPEFSLAFSRKYWLYNTFESSTETEIDDRKSEKFLDNYQKKIIPVKPLMPGWTMNENEDNTCESVTKKDGLIVVASLIDRVPNLGGLARTCEVFGASEYIINSLKHTENKQFTSLSVTAEKWITVKEVKIQNLLDYITEMKENGYTIVGAEQALYSQPLHEVKFPKKSILLLGNEKEGIPPNLLPFLDICVEVPQLGLIRSLNVHVTGALFIWEYAKQHHFT